MTPALALIKLAAFLHDPPHKPLALGRGMGHEAYAQQVRHALGRPDLLDSGRGERARHADHIASAADRPNFPSNVRADFWRDPALSHPLARSQADQPSVVSLGPLPGDLDLGALTRGVERAAQIISAQTGGDPERLYLTLWRYFPEYLRTGEADPAANVPPTQRLGLLWHALPADTRVPDHSVWDHLSITAAIAGALPQPAFLVFSLGPVQEFIAQARKTQDLWAASYLLSYLAWAGMRPLCEDLGPDCILYPALRSQPLVDDWLSQREVKPPGQYALPAGSKQIASLPNKFVALVPLQQASQLAKRAAAEIASTWHRLADEVRQYLDGCLNSRGLRVDGAVWQRQIDSHLETYWAVVPWPDPDQVDEDTKAQGWLRNQLEPWTTAEGLKAFQSVFETYAREGRYAVNVGTLYAPLHALAQRVFDAGKLARRFGTAEERGYKCTLCGRREPVLAGSASYPDQRRAWSDAAQALRAGELRPEGAERLCAVCLVKRLIAYSPTLGAATGGAPNFPSTSDMAAQPLRRLLMERADDPALTGPLRAFLQDIFEYLPNYNREAGFVLDAAVPEEREIGTGPDALRHALCDLDGEWLFPETYTRHAQAVRGNQDLAEALQEAERSLRRVLEQIKRRPSPYYAILLMDGDRMGRWVSGAEHTNRLRDLLHPEVVRFLNHQARWKGALDARRLFGPSTHAALSSALLAYARYSVPWIVEREPGGRVVYAGGDDVLALLPLPEALPAADALRQAYSRHYVLVDATTGRVSSAKPGGPLPTQSLIERHMGPDATASAGIALVHHLYPLGAALEQLRDWEKAAKDQYGRNAFVVGIIRRSGPDLVFGAKWHLLAKLREAQDAFARGELAGRTPYLVRELAERAGALPPDDARALVRSILERRERLTATPGQGLLTKLLSVLDDLGCDSARLADFLMIARFLAQEVEGDGAASLS